MDGCVWVDGWVCIHMSLEIFVYRIALLVGFRDAPVKLAIAASATKLLLQQVPLSTITTSSNLPAGSVTTTTNNTFALT